MHRAIGEQLQDCGAHVTAPAAAATAGSAAPTATTGAEAGAEAEAGTEAAGAEAAETGTESCVAAMFTDVLAEPATGLPTLFVQRTTVFRTDGGREAESAARERALRWCEWGVHVCVFSFGQEARSALPIR
ncbi:hypothetical protein MGALJ_40090 [Mycobacterium gallinarum]|uniref:Uncharacterized protein n=1 Tax=Mycobacterium gallinarum TaxID=39689 RepID=A0A9W4BAW3_9MYCO|nr:hypothetical protein MGALJ_40090 [Mycobacterium gallinarum]